jgi:hypothetical protein
MRGDISKSTPDRTTNTMEEKNRRRSERVVLRVPLLLSAIMPEGKRISIQVQTMVVNAHGGLLDVGLELVRGQNIRLSNLKMEIIRTARIVRVERTEEGRFSVAFEFEVPAPHFWPVTFPPPDWSSVHNTN